MTPENVVGRELSDEALIYAAQDLFNSALQILRKNENLKEACLRRYLEYPQGDGKYFNPGKIEFENNGLEFTTNRERIKATDRLAISTESEGIEEIISIWLIYDEEKHLNHPHLEADGRERVKQAILSYRKTEWGGRRPSELYMNNIEAVEKIGQFLRQI